jgi:hypothetical protein
LRTCSRCILPETFPGIHFDADGICNHCRKEVVSLSTRPAKQAEYRHRLDNLISTIKGRAPSYDAILAYSGGKDSSYTLKFLKERYGLRILAFTFDNHFVSPVSMVNIKTMVDTLGIDHISVRPPWPLIQSLFALTAEQDIFPLPTLLRASSICTACIGVVKSLALKFALEMSIPLVAFGWSPGQAPIQSAIMKTNPTMIRQNQKALKSALPSELAAAMHQYFIPEACYNACADRFPQNIHPLAFFEYDEVLIKSELQSLGWKLPSDTDSNSTNCLMNAFANDCHLRRQRFHPYVWEIANMVRQGVVSRKEGMEKIYTPQNDELVTYARQKLGL